MIIFPKHIQEISPYIGGMPIEELSRKIDIPVDQIIKLASNENPLGISDKAKLILRQYQDTNLYPDGASFYLINALAEKFNLKDKNIIIGNGSNDILEIAARSIAGPGDEVIFSEHAFAVYSIVTKGIGALAIEVPSKAYHHNLDQFLDLITNNTKLIFIANPNNPTGTLIPKDTLFNFIKNVPDRIMIVLDEAYDEYLSDENKSDAFSWINQFDNLLISRSFSKAYGLAGLRVGYGVASEQIISVMNRIRQPFNVNSYAQLAAVESLKDKEFVIKTYNLNAQEKALLEKNFEELNIEYIPSYGNFISFSLGNADKAKRCFEFLLHKGVILRPINNYNMPCFLRVSIGLTEENNIFINYLKEFLRLDK
ncbi:MAG: histidinol-phosphate transaminase [Nitrosomonadales bacterium]